MSEQQGKQAKGTAGVGALVRAATARALRLRPVRAYLLYSEHRGPALADSITYRTLFSVFAGVLLGFSLAALWLGNNPEAMKALADSLESVIPGLSDVVDLKAIEAPAGLTIVGAFSLLGLVGAALGAIGSLRTALRMLADELHDDDNPIKVMLRNLLVGVAFGALLIAAAVLSVASSIGVQTVASFFDLPLQGGAADWVGRVLGAIIVFAIDTVAVALVFRLLSGVSVPGRALWAGAMLGGLGLVVLQQLSGLFVRGAASNPLLASFAALIALLLWLNLSAQVILIASSYIIIAAAESRDRVRERFGAASLAQWRRKRAEDLVRTASAELRSAQEAEREEAEAAPNSSSGD